MRKYFILASALLLAACAKEAPVQEETQDRQEPQSEELVTYTISATINATKAYIDDTTVDEESGYSPLKWELGDKIALKSGESYTTFEIEEASDIVGGVTATFKAKAAPGKVFTKAYYPDDYRGGDIATYYASKYNNISLANSKKSFAMEATVGEGVNSIEFTQKGSLAKFTVSNVPSFTRKAKLVAGSSLTETVAITESEAATGSAVVYFAIPAGTYTLSFSLEDCASTPNTFYSKTRSSATYAAPHEYRYNVAVGPVVLIKNDVQEEVDSSDNKWTNISDTAGYDICFFSKYGETDYCTWSASVTNLTPITISDVSYGYFVYPASAEGLNVVIEICNKDGSNGYPKSSRTVTLTAGSQYFNFSYVKGLKSSSEKFCYIAAEDYASEGAYIYAWNTDSSLPFGTYSECMQESNYTGSTTMFYNGTVIRFLPVSTLCSSSKVKTVRAGDTSWTFSDNQVIGSDPVDGEYYLFTYNHQGGDSNWYNGVYTNTYAVFRDKIY